MLPLPSCFEREKERGSQRAENQQYMVLVKDPPECEMSRLQRHFACKHHAWLPVPTPTLDLRHRSRTAEAFLQSPDLLDLPVCIEHGSIIWAAKSTLGARHEVDFGLSAASTIYLQTSFKPADGQTGFCTSTSPTYHPCRCPRTLASRALCRQPQGRSVGRTLSLPMLRGWTFDCCSSTNW